MTIHIYIPFGILLSMHVQHAYAYETSFAMKHFNFYQQQPVIYRVPAGEIPRQQVEKLIGFLFESGSKSVGADVTEKVLKNYLNSMSLPMGANHDISKWTVVQCRQAIQRIEEDFHGKKTIATALKLDQDLKFKKGLESTIKKTRIDWAHDSKIKSPHDLLLTSPTNMDESQGDHKVPFWKNIPQSKPFSFDAKNFDMEQFGKSKNVSMTQALAAHPGVRAGQDVIYADPNIIITRDSSGKMLTVWINSEANEILTRFIADEPQEFVGITRTFLKPSAFAEAKYETVLVTVTPTQIHTYILSPNRAMNVNKELLPELMKGLTFGKIESFSQSKEHPSLFLLKSHSFFKRHFYTFDLMTMTLIEHNNETDLPN